MTRYQRTGNRDRIKTTAETPVSAEGLSVASCIGILYFPCTERLGHESAGPKVRTNAAQPLCPRARTGTDLERCHLIRSLDALGRKDKRIYFVPPP